MLGRARRGGCGMGVPSLWPWHRCVPLCGLHLFRLGQSRRFLDIEKRLFPLFVSLPTFSLLCSPAPLGRTELGFLMGGGCAGDDNHNAKCRLSAPVSSGQDQQGPPKWFRVTWCGSIVYLIKSGQFNPTPHVLFYLWPGFLQRHFWAVHVYPIVVAGTYP